ncbi:MAG TPA: M48 family peptidase [Deltaproteobacteria bacterium]|nr:M48 family peptidase [Deltaproteobacteria bacterium]
MNMVNQTFRIIVISAIAALLASCTTTPVTGRTQLRLVGSSAMLSMSQQQYDQVLHENELSTDVEATAMVKRVGTNIQRSVERYFVERGMKRELDDYEWEFNLIKSDEVNAWCMPGGKIAVYTGILPVTKDENGLAVVIAHEVGHAVAGHGAERMSHMLAAQLGGIALSVAMADRPDSTQQLWMTVFGLGAQVGFILPYSRVQEYEADHLGLVFMAMAGYDPEGAIEFWQRLAAEKKGSSPPAFLSTHPTDASRIQRIRSLMPETRRYYDEYRRTSRAR